MSHSLLSLIVTMVFRCPQAPCCCPPSTYMLQSFPRPGGISIYVLYMMTQDYFILISLMFLMTTFCRGIFAELVLHRWFGLRHILMAMKPWAELLGCNELHNACAIQGTNKRGFSWDHEWPRTLTWQRDWLLLTACPLTRMHLAWRMNPCSRSIGLWSADMVIIPSQSGTFISISIWFVLFWFGLFSVLSNQAILWALRQAVVMVVFSRKCLTFQTQQDVIDILNSIKCGPRPQVDGYNPFFFPHYPCLPYLESRKWKWAFGKAELTFWVSKHNSLVMAHSQPTNVQKSLSSAPKDKPWTIWPLSVALFFIPHSLNKCCSTSQPLCQVTGTSCGMKQQSSCPAINQHIILLRCKFWDSFSGGVHAEEEGK